MKQQIKSLARRLVPAAYFYLYYRHGLAKIARPRQEVQTLFDWFISNCAGKNCLQIGVKERAGAKFGPNWTSVDKFDRRPFIDRHDDIHSLGFPDATFDAAVCISIIEHVERPWVAVSELERVLCPGGRIWLQAPLAYAYHPDPKDFWRFSPDALRVLCSGFTEISAGAFAFNGPLAVSSYFYGYKK